MQTRTIVWSYSYQVLALLALGFLLLLPAFWGGVTELVTRWDKQEEYSHGYNEYWMKWYLLSDSLTRNRTDGSLVRLTTLIAPGEKEADADARLQRFMGIVDPKLDQYIPS